MLRNLSLTLIPRVVGLPRVALLGVAALLLLPHVFSSPRVLGGLGTGLEKIDTLSIQFGLPRIFSGDEPHYLVQLYSLVEDGDLDLANNYASVHEGSCQAGLLFRGTPMDHHAVWYEDGKFRDFAMAYQAARYTDRNGVKRLGHFLRKGATAPKVEYSRHPPGLALLLWPFVAPFRGTDLVEPVAVLCSGAAVLVALYFFCLLIEPYSESRWLVVLTAALVFLGTPIWNYGRSLFTEPYLMALTVAAFALFLRRSQYLVAGALFGVAVVLKSPFLLVAVPAGVYLLAQRRFKAAALYALPLAASVLVVLATNYLQFGSPLRGPQQLDLGNPLVGAAGQIFAWRHGVLPFAPICIVALFLWPRFLRTHRPDAALALASFAVYYGFLSFYKYWDGAFCYGPRYLVPVLPLLLLPLATLRREDFAGKPMRVAATVAAGFLSVIFNCAGAVPYWSSWSTHPGLCILARLLS